VDLFKYALLGILQGLTEFLPISSKSHLLLAEHWLGLNPQGVVLEICVHIGTLLSVLIVYGHSLIEVVKKREWKFIGLILLGTVVTTALILPFKEPLEELTQGPLVIPLIGALLLVTAMWLVLADLRLQHPVARRPLGVAGAVLVGLAQAIAILPGISRSGATIGMALQTGEDRENAARFSFILSVPVILGAAVLKAPEISSSISSGGIDLPGLSIAFVSSLLSGVAAIYILLWMLRRARLLWFAGYCVLLSAVTLISYYSGWLH
jgi:undecaprenyl-diphosphatase